MSKKIKTAASTYVCKTKEEVQDAIRKIGDLQREAERINGEANDEMAEIVNRKAELLNPVTDEITRLQEAVQIYCEAHRDELCGKGKTANLITGEVGWRNRPPSVRITGANAVIETLKRLGLGRFVRVKEEPNKEAMLNEPDAVQGVGGVNIVRDVEDFYIQPFEQSIAE